MTFISSVVDSYRPLMPAWWTRYPLAHEQFYHPTPGLMAQDGLKYEHGHIDPTSYDPYRRRVLEIEKIIPQLSFRDRMDLIADSVLSLNSEPIDNPTKQGLSPQNAAALRYLIKDNAIESDFTRGGGHVLLRKVDTKEKLWDIYRYSAFYFDNLHDLTLR